MDADTDSSSEDSVEQRALLAQVSHLREAWLAVAGRHTITTIFGVERVAVHIMSFFRHLDTLDLRATAPSVLAALEPYYLGLLRAIRARVHALRVLTIGVARANALARDAQL